MTRLELSGVSKRFGPTTALEDVSIAVGDGEFFTLVGPSGCGKTTTLRIVAGLAEPTAGTVRFGGTDVSGVPPEDRDVGIVFQSYALFPHMTVAENVGYGLRFRDPPGDVSTEARVEELLDLVDLGGMGDRDPEALSGGQQQRVALARALAPGPDLLLLDEPMSALDARLRERLRLTVREIQTELGITTLYVTHDQAEALAISDRVGVMHDGRIVQVGTPEEIYHRPNDRFVAAFVGDNNLFEVDGIRRVDGTTRAVVDTAEFQVPTSVSSGDVLGVRPESMTFGEGGTELQVRVESVEFLGDAYKVHCRWNGRDILVKARDRPPEGSATLSIPESAVQVIGGSE
ncbi:MAG: ABC transporter ATP-binding protein [Halodesulfurarchaeum sp.]